MSDRPELHYQKELERDLRFHRFVSDKVLMRWFKDAYSTSKHLLTLYSLARGVGGKQLVEIGFGRSTFVLARAAAENSGRLYTCDLRDFRYLFSKQEKNVVEYYLGEASGLWENADIQENGTEFIFIDYLSATQMTGEACSEAIEQALCFLKQGGLLCVHDAGDSRYAVSDPNLRVLQKDGIESVLLPYNYGLRIFRQTAASRFGSVTDCWKKKD